MWAASMWAASMWAACRDELKHKRRAHINDDGVLSGYGELIVLNWQLDVLSAAIGFALHQKMSAEHFEEASCASWLERRDALEQMLRQRLPGRLRC